MKAQGGMQTANTSRTRLGLAERYSTEATAKLSSLEI